MHLQYGEEDDDDDEGENVASEQLSATKTSTNPELPPDVAAADNNDWFEHSFRNRLILESVNWLIDFGSDLLIDFGIDWLITFFELIDWLLLFWNRLILESINWLIDFGIDWLILESIDWVISESNQ